MVANLTRYSACKVHPDSADRPVRNRKSPQDRRPAEQGAAPGRTDPTKTDLNGDEPLRLFSWVSA